jgi:hypothetical protein
MGQFFNHAGEYSRSLVIVTTLDDIHQLFARLKSFKQCGAEFVFQHFGRAATAKRAQHLARMQLIVNAIDELQHNTLARARSKPEQRRRRLARLFKRNVPLRGFGVKLVVYC